MERILFKPPDTISRVVGTASVISFLGALLGGAYGYSIHKKKVDKDIFTISQALAFGNQYIMVVFFTLAFMGIIFLNFYRSPKKLLIIRVLLLILMYVFLITIMWVTTFKNEKLHYAFAGIIFLSNLVYVSILTYVYQKYLKDKASYKTYLLDLNLMFAFAAMVIILVFGIFESDNRTNLDDAIFASTENFNVIITATTLLFLTFI